MAITLKKLRERAQALEAEGTAMLKLAEHYREVTADLEKHEAELALVASSGKMMADEMERILEEAGQKLHFKSIYLELLARGIEVAGEDPEKNTGAHLSLDSRFVSDGGGAWGLQKWQTEQPTPPTPPTADPLNQPAPTTPSNGERPIVYNVRCPGCQTVYSLEARAVPYPVVCPKCKLSMTVPAA